MSKSQLVKLVSRNISEEKNGNGINGKVIDSRASKFSSNTIATISLLLFFFIFIHFESSDISHFIFYSFSFHSFPIFQFLWGPVKLCVVG